MTNSVSVVSTSMVQTEDNMFAGLEPLTAFEVKRDRVATQLVALMNYCGKSRSTMAEELGWKKSRVSSVLSGRNNLTLKTICDFSTHLGYDFDVIFHGSDQPIPMQPWQIRASTFLPVVGRRFSDRLSQMSFPVIDIQSAVEVAADWSAGKYKKYYISPSEGVLSSMSQVTLPNMGKLIQTNRTFTVNLAPPKNELLTLAIPEKH